MKQQEQFALKWLLLAVLLQHLGDVCGQFTSAPPTCPNETFTFRCAATGNSNIMGHIIWRVGRSSECNLTVGLFETYTCVVGSILTTTVTIPSIDDPFLESTLSGTAITALDGTPVECFGPTAENMVGKGVLQIVDPPSVPTLLCVDLSMDTNGSLSATLTWILSGRDRADFYLININTNDPQPPYGGVLNITTPSVTLRELTGFQAGYEYTITVRSVNCGSQEGNESGPLTITPQVPRTPMPKVCAEYDGMIGTLQTIESTWNEVDPVSVSAGCSNGQDIRASYELSYTSSSGTSITTCVVDGTDCSNGVCRHELQNNITDSRCQFHIPHFNNESVTAIVTARNLVGRSNPAVSRSISSMNAVLGVDVDLTNPANVIVQCTFEPGYNCTAHYGTDPSYTNLDHSDTSHTLGHMTTITLSQDLQTNTTYYLLVSAESISQCVRVRRTFQTEATTPPLSLGEIVGIAVGIIVLCVLVVIIFVCVYAYVRFKPGKPGKGKESPEVDKEIESHYTAQPVASHQPSAELRRVLPRRMIIPSSILKLCNSIGQGQFGIVYKAHLQWHLDAATEVVAVKTLRGLFSQNEVDNLVREVLKMHTLSHPNVMPLTGVCLDSGGGPAVVMPYMGNGSVLQYLKKEREKLVPPGDADCSVISDVQTQLLGMCLQISKGMEYLAKERIVHRDLAARNCMMDAGGVIKVADFGLSEDIYTSDYYRQKTDTEVKLPVKWMPPESIADGIFTEKSDVWSFGVTCWEIFTGGQIPYGGVRPVALFQLLHDGERLNKPTNPACSDEIYAIILECWKGEPEERPDFNKLVVTISQTLEALAGYMDLSPAIKDEHSFGFKEEVKTRADGSSAQLPSEKEGDGQQEAVV